MPADKATNGAARGVKNEPKARTRLPRIELVQSQSREDLRPKVETVQNNSTDRSQNHIQAPSSHSLAKTASNPPEDHNNPPMSNKTLVPRRRRGGLKDKWSQFFKSPDNGKGKVRHQQNSSPLLAKSECFKGIVCLLLLIGGILAGQHCVASLDDKRHSNRHRAQDGLSLPNSSTAAFSS